MLRWNLCCVSNRLAADGHKFETMTYKRFASLPRDEAVAVLSARTLNNIRVTSKILEQCADNNWGYRVSSSLFPLLTYDTAGLDLESYPDRIEIMETLVGCSNIVRKKIYAFHAILTNLMYLQAKVKSRCVELLRNLTNMAGLWMY